MCAALGCAANTGDDLGGRAEAVVGSESSVTSVVAVVGVNASDNQFCSGVAIGPREIVTGRVCVDLVPNPCRGVGVFVDSPIGRDPDFFAAEVVMQGPDDAEYPLAVVRTSAPHGIPTLTLASAAPAVDDAVTLVGMGMDASMMGSGTRREASVTVIEYPDGPDGVLLTEPGVSCAGDMGGAVIAADGLTLLGVMFAGAGSACFGGGDGADLHADIFSQRAFLDAAIAADPPEACPGAAPVDSGAEADTGVDTDAGAETDGGGDTGTTADAGSPPTSDDGCGCTTMGQRRDRPAAPLFVVFAAVLFRLRRRRSRSVEPEQTPSAASLSLLLILLTLAACDGGNDMDGGVDAGADAATDSSSGGECGDFGTCFAPSVCIEDDAGEPTCSFDPLGAPTCAAIPEELAGALSVSGENPAHWYPPEDCIPVTYEAALEDAVPAITEAIATHQAVACNRLCLGAISSNEAPIDFNRGERRIHFRLGNDDDALTERVRIYQVFYGRTHMLFAGDIIVRPDVAGAITEREALGGLVVASGLFSGATPSVVNPPYDGPAELTDLDEAALCFLYGDPPACTYAP